MTNSFGGVRIEQEWIVGATDTTGRVVVVRVEAPPSTATKLLLVSSGALNDPAQLRYSHARADGNSVILSAMHWPFDWMKIDRDGRVILRPRARKPLSQATLIGDSLSHWISLGVVPLDNGYLQVLEPVMNLRINWWRDAA